MTKDERLFKRALDVLDWAHDVFGLEEEGIATKTALRDRLAQPEQEPVFDCPRCGHCCPPQGIYYTPQRKWVGLTDAVLAEREACAAMLDANAMACENPIYRSLLQANAQAIREMGQP